MPKILANIRPCVSKSDNQPRVLYVIRLLICVRLRETRVKITCSSLLKVV